MQIDQPLYQFPKGLVSAQEKKHVNRGPSKRENHHPTAGSTARTGKEWTSPGLIEETASYVITKHYQFSSFTTYSPQITTK